MLPTVVSVFANSNNPPKVGNLLLEPAVIKKNASKSEICLVIRNYLVATGAKDSKARKTVCHV